MSIGYSTAVLRRSIALALLATSCASHVRTVPLYLSKRAGDHLVVVEQLRGRDVPLIVDTGAPANILSSALAWYLGVPRSATGLELYDATSQRVAVHRVVGGLALRLGTVTAFAAASPRLDRAGYGGLFSPQALASRDRDVVLDLAAGTLTVARAKPHRPAGLVASACAGPTGSVYVAGAQIAGHAVRLVVDTGMPTTTIFASSAAGRALLADTELARAFGHDTATTRTGTVGAQTVTVLAGQPVAAGGTSTLLDVDVSPAGDAACRADGMLGLDFLAGWVLVIGERGLTGSRKGTAHPRSLVGPAGPPPIQFEGVDVVASCGAARPREARRYDDPLAGWEAASGVVRDVAAAEAAQCSRAGYLRVETAIDLVIAPDRRSFRGSVKLAPGRRYRNGRITLRMADGTELTGVELDWFRPGDWYDGTTDGRARIDRALAPRGLRVVGDAQRVDDDAARVDLEYAIGAR